MGERQPFIYVVFCGFIIQHSMYRWRLVHGQEEVLAKCLANGFIHDPGNGLRVRPRVGTNSYRKGFHFLIFCLTPVFIIM